METIKLGSKGESVKELQRILKLTPLDGVFGPKTQQAVISFQRKRNLTDDGIVGQGTWNALEEEKFGIEIIKKPLSVHITKAVNRDIKYLVLHYTAGGNSKQGKALSTYNTFNTRKASADFCVDDEDIVCFNPNIKNYFCWSVGDGNGKYGITNKNSISIEMCSTLAKGTSASASNHEGWSISNSVLNNTEKLVKYIMSKYNIPVDKIVTHYHASRKNCPGVIGWNNGKINDKITGKFTGKTNNENKFIDFKKRFN